MRRFMVLLVGLFFIFASISILWGFDFVGDSVEKKEGKAMKSDLERIEELHRADIAASKIGDVETLLGLWTEDGVMIRPQGEVVRGKQAIARAMEQYTEQLKNITIVQYEIDFKEVKVIGDHAYEWGDFHHKYYMKDNPGKILEQKGRLMRIMRRHSDGSWKVSLAFWTE